MKKNDLFKKWRFIKPLIIIGFIAAAGIVSLLSSAEEGREDDIFISDGGIEDPERNKEVAEGTDPVSKNDRQEQETSKPVVYICGEVKKPGLYTCDADSRIADVVELAGGFLEDADDTCVNMAERVTDSQQIIILKKGDVTARVSDNAGETGADAQGKGLININTADEVMLKTLPGIGDQKAKAIITYRQDGGQFSKIEDIMKVPGIKDGAFSKIKDLITV